MASSKKDKTQGIHLMVDRDELLIDGTDVAFRQYIFDTIAFSSRMKSVIEGHANIVGLPPPQYMILTSIMHLARTQDVNIKTVSAHLHLSGSFVTTSVNALVRLGLVDKVVDSKDRRKVRLRETEAARKRISRLAGIQNQVNNIMFQSLNRKDFETLSRLTAQLMPSAESALMLLSHFKVGVDSSS